MNRKTKSAPKSRNARCICLEIGPGLSEVLQRLRPPEAARRHFESARIEVLKGLRALLDARIEHIAKGGRKGQSIPVQ